MDTDIIIDFLRGKTPGNKILKEVITVGNCFVSLITVYELYCGAEIINRDDDVNNVLTFFNILPFDIETVKTSAKIYAHLKKKNITIEVRDILIAGNCKVNNICLATKNIHHFKKIQNLEILDISSFL